ncbi:hypothetical protein L596_010552 [Steinernema carpocapsae]|uniref:Uncharacterized protein n=1 Tax=Steinernema carpocapsae TaxID=34508 RepID=A0A4U5PJE2_STECR|nr:hypothetical protein L596_010552 [Steinernema carpocapsae]
MCRLIVISVLLALASWTTGSKGDCQPRINFGISCPSGESEVWDSNDEMFYCCRPDNGCYWSFCSATNPCADGTNYKNNDWKWCFWPVMWKAHCCST